MRLPRVSNVNRFNRTWEFFHSNAYDGSRERALVFLDRLENQIRANYQSRGQEFGDVLEKIDEIRGWLRSDTRRTGLKAVLDEKIGELSALLKRKRGSDPMDELEEIYEDFSDSWDEFVTKPTPDKAKTIRNLMSEIEALKGDFEEKAIEEKDLTLYEKYIAVQEAIGDVKGQLPYSIENSSTKNVRDQLSELDARINLLLSHSPELTKEGEEEGSKMNVSNVKKIIKKLQQTGSLDSDADADFLTSLIIGDMEGGSEAVDREELEKMPPEGGSGDPFKDYLEGKDES